MVPGLFLVLRETKVLSQASLATRQTHIGQTTSGLRDLRKHIFKPSHETGPALSSACRSFSCHLSTFCKHVLLASCKGSWERLRQSSWHRRILHVQPLGGTRGRILATHVCTYVRMCIHTYMCTCTCGSMHMPIHKSLYTYIHNYIHTYIYTYIHTYVHTYIHTDIHTYIRG